MKKTLRIMCVLGTRPEIIKMAPIIRATADMKDVECVVVHTGQHYSPAMDSDIFEDLGLDQAHYNLSVGSDTHAKQTGKIMSGVESVMLERRPDVVLVQGDTNTVLAAGLTAAKLHIPVGHIEAGLRSRDRSMPEEINRIVIDHIADFLFAPTEDSKEILLSEGITAESILVSGNTVVDAVLENTKIAESSSKILQKIPSKDYIFVTVHRAENVDEFEPLERIVKAITALAKKHTIVWPIHPRTKKQLEQYGLQKELSKATNIVELEPVGFLDCLVLQKHASVVLTDSGGLQEESCILGAPCVTMRENTERPETLMVGANQLVGTDVQKILSAVEAVSSHKVASNWKNPFGDGTAAQKIIAFLQSRL